MVTAPLPTGIFKGPYRMKLLIGSSATFRSVVEAADEATARKRIHYPAAKPYDRNEVLRENHLPPIAVVSDEDEPLDYVKGGVNFFHIENPFLTVSFQFPIPPEYADEEEDAESWFITQVEAIINEMGQNSGQGTPVSGETHLNVVGFRKTSGPFEIDAAEMELPDPEEGETFKQIWHAGFQVSYF